MASRHYELTRRLPPFCAAVCLRIRKKLLKYPGPEFFNGDSVVVAYSGGSDSKALAVILHEIGVPVVLAYLDHQLRPESGSEALEAKAFAADIGAFFASDQADVRLIAADRKIGLEEAGRDVRYAFLEKVRRQYSCAWIAFGHHLDDLCEDVLMRLIRGSGWPALGGMASLDWERRIIRPLLALRKDELRRFLRLLGFSWIEDASNSEPFCLRNRIRHGLIPLIAKENPSFASGIRKLHRLAEEDRSYWQHLLRDAEAKICSDQSMLFLSREHWIHLPKAVRLRLYHSLLSRFGCSINADTLFSMDLACCSGKTVIRRFPGGIALIARRDGLRVGAEQDVIEVTGLRNKPRKRGYSKASNR
ncbi:MAG: tRNA lysidine(34) synthetase TilS [Desulfovibrionaceae bacterium]|nr:tRNA lysidine(34) synthetase TilS [Desulfovibrionaceae bacterium]